MNVRRNCRMRGLRCMTCRRIRCASIASANKCRMRLMISGRKRSVLLTQIHLINRKPDSSVATLFIGYCPFSLINAAAYLMERFRNGYPVSYRQLLVQTPVVICRRVNFPRTFRLISIHAASTERFSSGEAKAIWLSPYRQICRRKRDSYWWQRGTCVRINGLTVKGQVLNPLCIGLTT